MKILIISALPFDISSSTRAFKTYFNSIDKNNLAQIYTNGRQANFDYCSRFFQITDKRMIKKAFGWNCQTGVSLKASNASPNNDLSSIEKSTFLKRDFGFLHLIRLAIWKEKRWFTNELKSWIEDFNPDCIFYHNSNSMFLGNVALKLADYYKLPLVVEISDDYIFGKRHSPFLFSTIYRKKYKRHFLKLAKRADGCFYISEKMKERYNVFNFKNADVVHVSSDGLNLSSKAQIPNSCCYFGNTGFNRDKTLIALGKRLNDIDSSFNIDVYSPLLGNGKKNKLIKKNGVCVKNYLPYNELIECISSYEYIIVAEPLDNRTAKYISMSLSTKVGDTLSSGKKIICIGNPLSGTIEYFKSKNCAYLISSLEELNLLTLEKLKLYNWNDSIKRCKILFEEEFSLESNSKKAYSIISNAISGFNQNEN